MIELLGNNVLGESSQGGGGTSKKYNLTINALLGDVNNSGVLQLPSANEDLILDGVTDITAKGLYYKFIYSNLKSVTAPDMESLTGDDALAYAFQYSSVESVSFPKLKTISSNRPFYYSFNNCTKLESISFPELTTIGGSENSGFNYAFTSTKLKNVEFSKLTTLAGMSFYRAFGSCNDLESVSFPEITTISESNTFQEAFGGCSKLTSVSFPNLTTISGQGTFTSAFDSCTSLQTITFPELTSLTNSSGSNFTETFNDCSNLTDIYFPKLTTITSSAEFRNLAAYLDGLTIHFKSGMESTVQALTRYPNFGGENTTVLFDL